MINGTKLIEEYSTEVEEGKIISQAPQANMPINEGDTITVVISKGNKEVLEEILSEENKKFHKGGTRQCINQVQKI